MSQWSSSPEFDPRPVIEEFCDMPCQNKPDQFVDSPKLKPLNQLEMYLKYTKPWVQSRVVGGSGGGRPYLCSALGCVGRRISCSWPATCMIKETRRKVTLSNYLHPPPRCHSLRLSPAGLAETQQDRNQTSISSGRLPCKCRGQRNIYCWIHHPKRGGR